jgi:hypothetical protein
MGVSLAWVGIQATTAEQIHATLGLTETGSSGLFYDFPIAGLALSNGWYLLAAKPCDHLILSQPVLSELSRAASVVACSIEEHVMFQSAALWRGGKQIWRVQHRGGEGDINDLMVDGVPPDNFEDVRAHYFAAQEQESAQRGGPRVDHVAEIPLVLAKSIVGFKHDEINLDSDDMSFRELREELNGLLTKGRRPKWRFW